MVYQGKPIRTAGVITDFEKIMRVHSPGYINSGNIKLYGVETRFPKAVLNNGEWEIEHDQVAEDAATTASDQVATMKTAAGQAKTRLRSAVTDLNAATSVADLKPVIRDVFRVVRFLMREIDEL